MRFPDFQIHPATPETLRLAAELLRAGEIVAIPTETVYGLAANALDARAVQKIFEAKGRPSHNPLIVHVPDAAAARALTADWPHDAETLAAVFWPGPLTLVLKRGAASVPDIVTAGGDTVALRCPQHPVALRLLELCGFPLAAPSANRSNAVSPTTAHHVAMSLGRRVPLILDGGACAAGIESTVLDLSGTTPKILRPGSITAADISKVLGRDVMAAAAKDKDAVDGPAQPLISPGLLNTHYAPDTPLFLVSRTELRRTLHQIVAAGDGPAGVMLLSPKGELLEGNPKDWVLISMPASPEAYAKRLYAELHHLDALGLRAIYCEMPPSESAWEGVNDRLSRAAFRVRTT